MKLGDKIKSAREAQGIGRAEFAELLGLSYQAVQQWELNKTTPRQKYWAGILKYTNKPADYFGSMAAVFSGSSESQGLRTGSQGSDATVTDKVVHLWDSPSDLPRGEFVMVPRLDVEAAAGAGRTNGDWPKMKNKVAYRADWISDSPATTTNLIIVKAHGNSMMPYICGGDDVLLDQGQKTVRNGNVYAFVHHGEVRLKRMFIRGDTLVLHSDNEHDPQYRYDEELTGEEADDVLQNIIGRAVNRSGSGGL